MGGRERERLFLRFERWGFDTRGYSPRTRRNYVYRVKAAEAWLVENERVSVAFAKDRQLRAYLASTTPDARNRNHIRQALVAFFDFLIDLGMRDDNPAAGIKRLKTKKSIPKALPADEAQRFIDAAKLYDERAQVLACLLAYQGMRIDPIRTLQWPQLEGETVRFVSKGQREWVLPLHPETIKALDEWRKKCPDPTWVFPSPHRQNKPLSDTWIRTIVRDIAKAARINRNVHPHIFRHTFATHLLEQGFNLRVVQEALGHASLETTAIYPRVTAANLKEIVTLDYRPEAQ